jgi:formyltetrahydrofolate deformylase
MDLTGRRYTLTISCPDRVGIVAAVSGFIAGHGGWILDASHHSDHGSQMFFMRHEILAGSLPFAIQEFRERFARLAEPFGMDWRIADSADRRRVVLLVSRQDHCLNDLLHRWRNREFDFDIPCVISNHDDLRSFVEWHGIPYFHVPVDAAGKEAAFRRILALYQEHRGEVMVLARYMQVLPSWLCEELPGQVLNIHHSFLPSFMGAKPYHQAYERGVKLIGATCHYVTPHLDEGPIIEQDVIRVDHGDSPQDLVRYGRDIEKTVLARGLRYHVEDRVLLSGSRTVVFK